MVLKSQAAYQIPQNYMMSLREHQTNSVNSMKKRHIAHNLTFVYKVEDNAIINDSQHFSVYLVVECNKKTNPF